MLSLAIAVHVLAAVIWIGGMFFAVICLRPALGLLDDPAQRLSLVRASLQRFFRWVWLAVLLLPITGFWMTTRLYAGFSWPPSIWIMAVTGIVMILLFLHVYFAPWRRMNRALDKGDTAKAPEALESIRRIITVNLILGMIVAVVASAGRYL